MDILSCLQNKIKEINDMNGNRNQIRIYLIFVLGICWALGIAAFYISDFTKGIYGISRYSCRSNKTHDEGQIRMAHFFPCMEEQEALGFLRFCTRYFNCNGDGTIFCAVSRTIQRRFQSGKSDRYRTGDTYR